MDTFKYCVLLLTFIALLCVQNNLTAALNNTCTHVSNCTSPNETCAGGRCVCSSDYYEEADACVMKKTYGDQCSEDNNCKDRGNISCIQTTTTNVKRCLCEDGFYFLESSCESLSQVAPLLVNTTIGTGNIEVRWTASNLNNYETTFQVFWSQLASIELDESKRSYNIQSLSPGTTYTVHLSRHITRHERRQSIGSVNQTYSTLQVYGGECNGTNCDTVGDTIKCDQDVQKCLCVGSTYWSGAQCYDGSDLKPVLPESISASTKYLNVTWMAGNTSHYSTNYRITWSPAGSTTGRFETTNKYHRILALQEGSSYNVNVIRILSNFGKNWTMTAVSKVYNTKQGYDGNCSGSIQCDSGITCDQNVNKCLCGDKTYWNGISCTDGSNLTPALNDTVEAGTNFIEVTWTATDTSYYITFFKIAWSSGEVQIRSHETQEKSYKIEGLSEGSSYSVSLSRILTKYGKNRTIAALPKVYNTKISYGGRCERNGTCINNNTNCFGDKCLCKSRFYRNNESSQCESLLILAPTFVRSDTPDTTSVVIHWVESDKKAYITKYRVAPVPRDPDVSTPQAVFVTGNYTHLNNLNPGSVYNVTVAAESRNEERIEYESAPATMITTKPAMVKRINNAESNFTGPDITIVFTPAEGKVERYSVQLVGDDPYNKTISMPGTNTKVTFTGVTSGNYYNITITTISGNKQSDPFTITQRVMAAQSESVRDFNRSLPTSRSVFVSWKRPNKTNGALFEYSLEIYHNDSDICVFRIVFNCTDCTGNRMVDSSIKDCHVMARVPLNETQITDRKQVITYNITGLDPVTGYKVLAVAYTEEGRGRPSVDNIYFQTVTEAAQTPTSFTSTDKTSNSITLSWEPQRPRPGVTEFVITVYERSEDNGGFTMLKNRTTIDEHSVVIDELSSYWDYIFSLQAYTSVLPWSHFINISSPITTKESVPDEVENLEIKTGTIKYSFNKVVVQWICPKPKDGRNGVITSATLKFESVDISDVPLIAGNKTYNNDKSCQWEVVVDVTPEYNYTFTVYIQNTYKGNGSNATKYIPGGPPDLSTTVVSIPGGGGVKSDSETFAPVVISPQALHNGKNGRVISTGIIVSKPGMSPVRKKRESLMREDHYNQLDTWKKSKASGFSTEYRATPADWIDDKKDTKSMEFLIGSNKTCDSAPGNVFCNGPLPPGSTFEVRLFACTNVGCTESTRIKIITQEPPNNIPLIVGAVVAAVVAVFLVILAVWLIRRRKKNTKPAYLEADEIQEGELIQKKRPIRISAFEKRVEEMHKDSNLLFSEEFEDINALSPKHSCTASETGGNKLKNRYVNILPFDNSRVKLLPTEEDDEETDYINANYIPGCRSQREYIATQGPMTGTVNDFWRMIWEQNVPIIVMLSDLMEKGKPKVDRYYPENMEPVQYGDIVVEMTNYSPLSKYVIRIFKLQLGDEVRMVRHYFLPGWQDFGANLTSDDVINFLKSVRMEIKPNNQGPICVHCSAGVGRTGTYISLDVFQQHIDEENLEKELDIFDFALKMRQNRSYMIQTEKQYIFVHDTIKEMIIRKKKEMSERDHIYQNSGQDDNVYENQAFEADVDTQDIYMNVDSATGKPTTAL